MNFSTAYGGVHNTCGNSGHIGERGGGRFVLKKWKFWEGEGVLHKIYCVVGLWISSGFYIVHLEHSNNKTFTVL